MVGTNINNSPNFFENLIISLLLFRIILIPKSELKEDDSIAQTNVDFALFVHKKLDKESACAHLVQ